MTAIFGKYADFILTSYGLVVIVVLGLIASIIIDYRRQRTALRDLEARGVTRRSDLTGNGLS
ncbi:MAG: heme exporter protein CcmD [Xanthobacteraceae bacterium]|nr:heme exporter protein CcmD [Xanthobacteraceae bacterium]